jgi:plasmid stabilization system protein ParE
VSFEVKSEAQEDARQAASYYDGLRIGLGGTFLNRLHDAYAVIQQHPQAYSLVHPAVTGREIRYYVMRQFPYLIVYEVLPGRVVILAVVHNKRRPGSWRRHLLP